MKSKKEAGKFLLFSLTFVLFAILVIQVVLSDIPIPRPGDREGAPSLTSITLNYPPNNGASLTTTSIIFKFTPNSPNEITQCNLFVAARASNFGEPVKTKGTITKSSINVFDAYDVGEEGDYKWYVVCQDAEGSLASQQFNFKVDFGEITLNLPADNDNKPEGQIDFTFTTPNIDLTLCNLDIKLNGEGYKTASTTPNKNTQNSFNDVILSQGVYTWQVKCADTSARWLESTTRTLKIGGTPPDPNGGGGDAPVVELIAPSQVEMETIDGRIDFVVEATVGEGQTLKDATLEIKDKNKNSYFTQTARLSGTKDSVGVYVDKWFNEQPETSDYKWNFKVCDTNGNCNYASSWKNLQFIKGSGNCDKLNVMEEFFHSLPDIVQGLILGIAALAGIAIIITIISKIGGFT